MPSVNVVIRMEKMSLGRTSKNLDPGMGLFDVPFLIETACARSKKIQFLDPDSGEKIDDYEESKILMFGYSPDVKFAGEVTLKMYNGFCMITPKPPLEEMGTDDEDDEDDLRREILGSEEDDSGSSESGSESEESSSQSSSSSPDAMSVSADGSARTQRYEPPLPQPQHDPFFDPLIGNQTEDDMLLSSPRLGDSTSLELYPIVGQDLAGENIDRPGDDLDKFVTDDFTGGVASEFNADDYEMFDSET